MKRVTFGMACAVTVCMFSCSPAGGNRETEIAAPDTLSVTEESARATFSSTRIDGGTFTREEAVREFVFTFKNTGTLPLEIYNVEVSCGCMTPHFPADPIPPGMDGEISVTYDGRDKVDGIFEKGLTVITNAPESRTALTITGNMLP